MLVGLGGTIEVVARAGVGERAPPRDGVLDVDLAWLAGRARDWDRLAASALSATPFYSRHVLEAHVRHGITPAPRVLTAWRAGSLVGLWPYRTARVGWGRRVHAAWTSPYVTASTPLVGPDRPADDVGLLLDAMAARGRSWLLPRFPVGCRVGAAVLEACARRGWPTTVLAAFDRPVLDRRETYAAYEAGRSAGRRKDLRRRLRRLGEQGAVSVRSEHEGPGLAAAIDAFLQLEAAGWKGRRGTALASHSRTAAFGEALFGATGASVASRADLLLLDGRPIAVSLALLADRTAFLLKTTYDEDLARFAPGVILENAIVRALHETSFADRLDSAAGPGTPLDELYPDREPVGDVLLVCNPVNGPEQLARLAAAERQRGRLTAFLKSARDRIRGR